MKVGVLADGAVRLEERSPPALAPGEIRVALAACGICGTDLEKLRGNYRSSGGVLGHEAVGVISETAGPVEGFSPGDRVFVHHHVPCYRCAVCRRGDLTFCPEYARSNLDPGGFAEGFRVSAHHLARGAVLPLAPSVGWEEGALLEPAGCAWTALRSVGFPAGGKLLVLGLGPVGLLYARVARARGAGWVGGTDPSPLRREAARRGGIDAVFDPTTPEELRRELAGAIGPPGVDVVAVATGAPAAVEGAFDSVRRGGTVNLFGLPEAGSTLHQDLQSVYLRGIRIVPTYATTEGDLHELHRLVSAGRLPLKDLVTHRFPLDRIGTAFEMARQPDRALKVLVTGPAYLADPSRREPAPESVGR
ncbi:MAG: alcohol dehydrogenase catalytic domain-containing protein [Thermoplasmata archaeon]